MGGRIVVLWKIMEVRTAQFALRQFRPSLVQHEGVRLLSKGTLTRIRI